MGEAPTLREKIERELMGTGSTESHKRVYYLPPGIETQEFLQTHSVETPHGRLVEVEGLVPGFYRRNYSLPLPPHLLVQVQVMHNPAGELELGTAAIIVSTVPILLQPETDILMFRSGRKGPFTYLGDFGGYFGQH